MFRNILLTLLVILAAAVAVKLALPRRVPAAPPSSAARMLAMRIPELKLRGVTTEQAIELIGSQLHLPVRVDWTDLQVLRKKMWEIDLHDVALGDALHMLFAPGTYRHAVPADNSWRGVDFVETNGALFIRIAPDDPPQFLYVYDVRDLLSDSFWGVGRDPVSTDTSDIRTNRDEVIMGLFSSDWSEANNWESPTGTRNWESYGPATERLVSGRLLMIQTRLGHENTERILARLRASQTSRK